MQARWQGIRAIAAVLAASQLLFSPSICHANNWDADRARYISDVKISDLAGPVRELTEQEFQGSKLINTSRLYFDAEGNLTRREGLVYENNGCTYNTYTYDSHGYPLSETYQSGEIAPGGSCQNRTLNWTNTHAYELDNNGVIVVERTTTTSPFSPTTVAVSKYLYDSARRVVRKDFFGGAEVRHDQYAYADEPQGVRITRQVDYSSNNGHLTYDLIRDLLYAPDGRLLELSQVPADVAGFAGKEMRVYSSSGQLDQQITDVSTTYPSHDQHGNWTESTDTRGNRTTRQIEYW
jgi:hypothetical protein